MTFDKATLVVLLATTASVDKTSPDPNNLRNGWRTDILLAEIDRFVVIEQNNPAAYADICRLVSKFVKNLPEISALVQLGIFRGERLLPMNTEREQALLQMAEELGRIVSALPGGTRKMRCLSLLDYHRGVFYNDYGHFDQAAKMQSQSAENAKRFGDKPGEAIGHFLSVFYSLKHALRNNLMDEAQVLFENLKGAFNDVIEATRDTAFQVQWAEGNCPVHMIEASIWLSKINPIFWERWVGLAVKAGSSLGGGFEANVELIKAVHMDFCHNPGAEGLLEEVASGVGPNEIRATALLVLAYHAMGDGKNIGEIIGRMPEQGAQHVCAIARRMLA